MQTPHRCHLSTPAWSLYPRRHIESPTHRCRPPWPRPRISAPRHPWCYSVTWASRPRSGSSPKWPPRVISHHAPSRPRCRTTSSRCTPGRHRLWPCRRLPGRWLPCHAWTWAWTSCRHQPTMSTPWTCPPSTPWTATAWASPWWTVATMATMPIWTSHPSTLCRWEWWEHSHTPSSPCRLHHMATWCTLQLVTMVTWTLACPSSPWRGLSSGGNCPQDWAVSSHVHFAV